MNKPDDEPSPLDGFIDTMRAAAYAARELRWKAHDAEFRLALEKVRHADEG